ncbi:MAG: 3'-5' exonuclease, partial [Candidatus Promineifilaceae bacterium]
EAQDSVPLQEQLLKLMTGADGNWVRVGDPNQAITSSFTSAHPRQFNAFLDRADVVSLPLPHSGRNAPFIFGAANSMVKWVVEKHPVPEVRKNAFRPLDILPAPEGDEQPNPPNNEAAIQIQVFRNRELEELPAVVKLAAGYAAEKVEHTLAILVPTHNVGYQVVRHLDAGGIDYDNQLRNTSEIKEVAASLTALLALLSSPLNTKAIAAVFSTLYEIEHTTVVSETIQPERIHTLLLSIHKPESFLFALGEQEFISSLPMNVADEEEVRYLRSFAKYLRSLFSYRSLAFDDMILALADELYLRSTSTEASRRITDLAIAYQLAGATRSWLDIHPEWRLPEITSQLSSVARGKHSLPINIGETLGFKPRPGRITLATQHGAKGMEWDAVFLVGIDGQWIPSDLDSSFYGVRMPSGGDPVAEASAKLHQLMDGSPGIFPGRSATEAAHIELICERLRLLYVGITRARRYLHISRSLQYRTYDKDIDTKPAAVVGMLYRYVRANQQI